MKCQLLGRLCSSSHSGNLAKCSRFVSCTRDRLERQVWGKNYRKSPRTRAILSTCKTTCVAPADSVTRSGSAVVLSQLTWGEQEEEEEQPRQVDNVFFFCFLHIHGQQLQRGQRRLMVWVFVNRTAQQINNLNLWQPATPWGLRWTTETFSRSRSSD